MKVEAPLLPGADVRLPKIPHVSFRVPKIDNPGLRAIQEDISPYGTAKGAHRVREDLGRVLDLANRRLQASTKTRHLRFVPDEASGKTIVRLMDPNGNEIRQYPSEKILENASVLKGVGVVKLLVG